MDGGRLLRVFVDRQGETPVGQFAVRLVARGREQQGHRAFHFVMFGAAAARVAVLGGHGQRQAAFALQELERVAGFAHAFLFGHGQDLVFQFVPAQVVERLTGEGRPAQCASGGISCKVASSSDVLPAAELLWINTDKGRGKRRDTHAR